LTYAAFNFISNPMMVGQKVELFYWFFSI